MKKSLLLFCFALFSVASFAQVSFSKASNWHAKAGLDISNYYGGDYNTDALLGVVVGVGCDYPLTKKYFLQPSALLVTKGSKMGDVKWNATYLELPLMAATRFPMSDNMNVVVNAGPFVAVGIAGRVSGGGISTSTFDTFGDRFDVGAGVGAALEVGKLIFGIDAKVGLLDVGASQKNISSAFTVGYKF